MGPNNEVSAAPSISSLLSPTQAKKYQIVFVTAEVAPWSQTGGLGAVADGLPITLAKAGHRVMSIAPRYDQYADAWDTSISAEVLLANEPTTVRFFHTFKQGVDRLWVDHAVFLEKVWGISKEKLYGPAWGVDFRDNQARFAMFSQAVLKAITDVPLGGFPYGTDVIILCNDWHSSLVPLYLHREREIDPTAFKNTKTVFCSHNMVYQGRFPLQEDHAKLLSLPQAPYIDSMSCFMPLKVGKKHPRVDCLNWMMGAFSYSDQLMTVSPGYGAEILSGPIKGVELDELAADHGRKIRGILNGLKDNVVPHNPDLKSKGGLAANFTANTLERKLLCKAALQRKFELPIAPEIPLFCFLGRYDVQKGIDVLFQAFVEGSLLADGKMQVIVMGSGTRELLDKAILLAEKFPDSFKAVLSFKGTEKYQVFAGADFAVVPSRYEPCGLVQMEAMRFGTIPVVSPTGGLADTVVDLKTGLIFDAELDPESEVVAEDVETLSQGLERCVDLFSSEPEKIMSMRKAAMEMSATFTWDRAAREYEEMFEDIGVADVSALVQPGLPTAKIEVDKAI